MALAHSISIMGSPISDELIDALTGCDINADLSQVTQLEMKFADPRWRLLDSGLFTLGQRVEIGGFRLEISNINTTEAGSGTEGLSIKCRPIAYRLLKARTGPRVMNSVSPSEFVQRECAAVGITAVVQSSARRTQISRDVPQKGQQPDIQNPPSSWSTFQRLAQEIGFVVFENQDVVYFAKPSYLVSSGILGSFPINYITGEVDDKRTLTIPQCARSLDDPAVTVSTSMIVEDVNTARPGKVAVLSGVPTFNGNYLCTGFSGELLETPNAVTVNAATPIDPIPSLNSTSSGITGPWYDESKL